MKLFTVILTLLALITQYHAAPTSDSEKAVDYRLEDTILPSAYRIQLTPFLLESDGSKRFSFEGFTAITLKPQISNLKTITLHAKGLVFQEIKLSAENSENEVKILHHTPSDSETDKFDIELDTALGTQFNYTLSFKYTGVLSDDMRGFYRSKYTNEKNEEVWIGSTQFQTNHARRAFPCFDEPKFKAKFKIDITHPNHFTVVSNTMSEGTDPIPDTNLTITSFKETPTMSTYLVAFIVSDFKARGTDGFTVIARPEAYYQTEYAYEVGPKLLKNLNEFTAYPYSEHGLQKMDLAGIPDFSAGAMENWGLLTYRETALLYDPDVSTLLNQQRVASVISHELGHQWFGDLVTCDWWGYTWLNEGFGRYFQYFTTNEVEKSWELDKQFVVEQIQVVMNMDSLPGTTPMSDPTAASPADLSRMFNSISYNKGATILRMVKHMITESNFKTALQEYLRARDFKTAIPENLFDAFAAHTTHNISSILRDWTDQVGYPVVTVTLDSNGTSFTVKQKRFLLREDGNDGKLLYQIPFTYTTDAELNFDDTSPKTILPKSSDELTFELSKPAKWVIANIQETGYYRVNYDEKTWSNIREALVSADFGKIHELNRAQIVDDVFNLGRAGYLQYDQVINILNYLKSEVHYLPWYAAFQGYSYLTTRLGADNQKYFQKYILALLDRAYKDVTFTFDKSEKRLKTYNRANVLSWACRFEHADCVKSSQSIFKTLIENNTSVEVNIRNVVYCTAIHYGGETEFQFLWDKFKKENVATEQVLILGALGCSKDKDQIHKYLDLILSGEVRLQDRQAAFQGTYTSFIESVDIVWEYVQKKYKDMITSFGSQTTVANLISGIASRFTTPEQRNSLDAFIKDHATEFGSSASTLEKSLDSVDYNIKWASESLDPFVKHLKSLSDGAVGITASSFLALAAYIVACILK